MATGKVWEGKLLKQVSIQEKKLGVAAIRTLADWSEKNLMVLFNRSRFVPSKRISVGLGLKWRDSACLLTSGYFRAHYSSVALSSAASPHVLVAFHSWQHPRRGTEWLLP